MFRLPRSWMLLLRLHRSANHLMRIRTLASLACIAIGFLGVAWLGFWLGSIQAQIPLACRYPLGAMEPCQGLLVAQSTLDGIAVVCLAFIGAGAFTFIHDLLYWSENKSRDKT